MPDRLINMPIESLAAFVIVAISASIMIIIVIAAAKYSLKTSIADHEAGKARSKGHEQEHDCRLSERRYSDNEDFVTGFIIGKLRH